MPGGAPFLAFWNEDTVDNEYLATIEAYRLCGKNSRYDPDRESFQRLDKYIVIAVIAIRGCRDVQPQLSLVRSIARCLQEPEFLQRHHEKRVYFTGVEEAGCYISQDGSAGDI